ncbi:MAG: hypothetical protein IJE07_03125 [Clostridia bacterium]|nr:hypothetical protein [Clostridia bacterium]
MLIPVEHPDAHIAAFWPVALDLTHSAYPTYTDGIKTRADFAEAVHRAHRADWGEVLVHLHEGEVNGLLVIDVADDEFVSLHVCLTHAHQPECLAEALDYIAGKHPGKTLWLGFAPENAEMLTFAEKSGFTLLDDTVNWNIALADWQPLELEMPVQPVSRENYAAFRALWTDASMYWNAERIEAALDRWMLFVTADGRGAVACLDEGVMLEIFGFQYRDGYDEAVHRALMTACLNASKAKGAQYLTYFSDRCEAAVMQSLGFRRVSDYRCYEKKL